jgi:hypothetical protein
MKISETRRGGERDAAGTHLKAEKSNVILTVFARRYEW